MQEALGGKVLPFVRDPVVDGRHIPAELASAITEIDEEVDEFGRADIAVAVADMLASLAGQSGKSAALDIPSLSRVRDLIAAEPENRHSLVELERLTDLDRWALTRQFRAAFGTTPVRYRTMRQLDRVRQLLKQGTGLAEASTAAGFADQSHMSRHFKRAYGLTPGRWMSAVA